MKNIVICCDGTWKTREDRDGGVPVPTNVVRIFNAVAHADRDGGEQHRYYHPGVGAEESFWMKKVAGGTGKGLDRNIISAYRELADTYQDGDAIFLFGFSRGAYTARSLAGMIGCCGLLDTRRMAEREAWDRIEQLFQQGYRTRRESRAAGSWKTLPFHFGGEPVPIRFLGVWDTVGALGIPDHMGFLNLFDRLEEHAFHDVKLGAHIENARHALSLDEMRASFQPTLWVTDRPDRHRHMWFAGVHSDVGGGYRETGLSDIALKWMCDEAERAGLGIHRRMLEQLEEDPQGILHDSCTGAYAMLPTQPRSIPRLVSGDTTLHPSVHLRRETPPISQCPYRYETPHVEGRRSSTSRIFARDPWNATGIWLEAGRTYTFRPRGEWMDASIQCGPGGTKDGKFQVGEIAHVLAGAVGAMEDAFRTLSRNEAAELPFTRRHEEMPWFSLVGAIANGGVDPAGHAAKLVPHETFLVGEGCTYVPRKPGYLYAYANDAWGFYGNNRGRVELTVEW